MEKRIGFIKSELRAEQKDDKKVIRGYAIVFDEPTQLYGDVWEEISPDAIADGLGNIRALYNHNMDIVLGTTDSNTVRLRKDDKGLYAEIDVNENDPDAVGAYARIERGDIPGWSFGFMPLKEEFRSDGDKQIFRVTALELYEVSPCVFPAYPQTSIEARKADIKKLQKRELTMRKQKLLEKTKRR